MTHEETSLQTKQKLSSALKEIMKHKPFSKITISELIKNCNLNRKTFYYHFQDIYELLTWTLEQETFSVVSQFNMLTEYKDALDFVLDYVEENTYFLNCMYDSVGRDMLKRFLCDDFIDLVEKMIRDLENELQVNLDDDFRNFIVCFYTEAGAGMIVDLFQQKIQPDRERLYQYFSLILHHSLPALLLSQADAPVTS